MHLPVAAGAQRVQARDAHQHTGIALCSQSHKPTQRPSGTRTHLAQTRNGKQSVTRKKTCEKLGACNCRTFHRPRLLPWESVL